MSTPRRRRRAKRTLAMRATQRALSAAWQLPDCPTKFRAIARWHLIHALESRDAASSLRAAEAQARIAADMEVRPGHHARMPANTTRYLWSLAA